MNATKSAWVGKCIVFAHMGIVEGVISLLVGRYVCRTGSVRVGAILVMLWQCESFLALGGSRCQSRVSGDLVAVRSKRSDRVTKHWLVVKVTVHPASVSRGTEIRDRCKDGNRKTCLAVSGRHK